MLPVSVVLITSALVAYTIGVWGEHRQRSLRLWHAVCFGIGLCCDASGTYAMSRIAATTDVRGTLTRLMMITGSAALVLMALHLAWAVVVLVRNRDGEKRTFHRFSLAVWLFWLVPYLTGAIGSMAG